jgi:beta-lactamase regulating signal transducer with metallopeptidase domain
MWGLGFVGLGVFDLWRIFKSGANDLKVPANLQKQFSQLAAVMNVRAPVELYVSENAVSPYAEGLHNPRVVLPAAMAAMPLENLRHILAHELVHVRDRDSAWKAFELFTRRMLFFNPFMYLLAQKHLLAIEKAADEEAVLKTQSRVQDYIQTLIEVVSQHRAAGGNPLALNASKTFKETKARMESLILAKNPPKKNFVNAVILASVLASVGMSVAQARSTVRESVDSGDKAMMCLQVHHEQIIESWLNMKPETNKCE